MPPRPRDLFASFRTPDRTPEVLRSIREVRTDLAHLRTFVLKGLQAMTEEMTRITESVRQAKTVMDSAEALLGKLSQQIRDLKNDPTALLALADELDAERGELAKAITDNTPAEGTGDGEPTDDGTGEAPPA